MRPPANTFLRCSTFGKKKGSNSTPASRCLPRLCSIGEQSGERGLLRVANGATFTKSLVRASPPRCLALLLLCVNKERERERSSSFLSSVFGILFVFRVYPRRERIRCDSSAYGANDPSSQRLFSPLQRTSARTCSLSSHCFFLSFAPLVSLNVECHLVNNESDEFLRDFV